MSTTQTGVTSLNKILDLQTKSNILPTDFMLIQDTVRSYKLQFSNIVYNMVDNETVTIDSNGKLKTLQANIQNFYPIGSVYMSTSNSFNPSTLFGFGTWQRISQGRVLVGEGVGTDQNNTSRTFPIGETGGEYTHQLTVSETPSHTHTIAKHQATSRQVTNNTGRLTLKSFTFYSETSSSTGGNQSHNNNQPYLAVYMWVRIS